MCQSVREVSLSVVVSSSAIVFCVSRECHFLPHTFSLSVAWNVATTRLVVVDDGCQQPRWRGGRGRSNRQEANTGPLVRSHPRCPPVDIVGREGESSEGGRREPGRQRGIVTVVVAESRLAREG